MTRSYVKCPYFCTKSARKGGFCTNAGFFAKYLTALSRNDTFVGILKEIQVRDFFQTQIQPVNTAVDGFDFTSKRRYANLCAQTYYYVAHSTRLLARAASNFGVDNERLHVRFAQHMNEEKSHHLLASHDVKALGYSLDDFPELAATSFFYEAQYFKVERNPFSLFGYILALEGLAVERGKYIYERSREAHGAAACSFIKVHAEDDISHLQTAFSVIESLSAADSEVVRRCFVQAVYGYGQILASIMEC
ncbi:MAG: hypothetical protein EOO38_07560 [Cytophagaceae bacterium]|nr:MAG: hypothetical protein EOO38_07560 [Cytophagaceae bacterium]